jgi:hypothetical protein
LNLDIFCSVTDRKEIIKSIKVAISINNKCGLPVPLSCVSVSLICSIISEKSKYFLFPIASLENGDKNPLILTCFESQIVFEVIYREVF